jgi:indolepyruvate ferredoxin oxidoreductase alpha subunit
VAVVEELDPFIEEQVERLGLPVVGKRAIPVDGELDQETVRSALEPFVKTTPPRRRRLTFPAEPRVRAAPPVSALPVRPPALCAGCPHRAVFAMLRRRKVAALGDIGCYTLGALPPLLSLDSCLSMGASIGMMAGMNKALGRKAAVAVIGDSTFFHSGVTPLIDAHYNQAPGLVIVLDNRTTAMTGHQGHPGTGLHPDGSRGPALDIEQLCLGVGVRCHTVDAFDEEEVERLIKNELAAPDLGVLVALAPCVLTTKPQPESVLVDDERCNLCGLCVDLGCPALVVGDAAVEITADCGACGVCVAVCARGALSLPERDAPNEAEAPSS